MEKENYRIANIQKATEARRRKTAERRAAQEALSAELTTELNKSVKRYSEDSDVARLKSDFYRVFDRVGGVQGMAAWVRADKKNRLEYYKLFIGLLKAESIKQVEGQKQQVVVNIIAPNEQRETVIGVRTEG